MGHEELGKLFRNIIQQDESELSAQELDSKASIWAALEVPEQQKRNFPFWKIAASLFFLLWGGTACWFFKHTADSKAQLQQLEQQYQGNEQHLQSMQTELHIARCSISQSLPTFRTANSPEAITRYVDRIVEVRDTIWVEKTLAPEIVVEYIRDTIWAEVPVKEAIPTAVLVQQDTIAIEQTRKRPSKIAFIFKKSPLKTPTKSRVPLLVNEHEIVEKTEQHNNGLITVKIN